MKRMLATLLALCMIIGTGVMTAFAAEGDYEAKIGDASYKTLEKAVEGAEANDTITLLKDVTLESQLSVPAGVTIDGGGNTIFASESWNGFTPDTKYLVVGTDNTAVQNVVLENLYEGSSGSNCALQFYNATNAKVSNVSMKNFRGVGLNINASTVTATGHITLVNCGWGNAINVSYGSDITSGNACKFDFSIANVTASVVYADDNDVRRATNANTTISFVAPDTWIKTSEYLYAQAVAQVGEAKYASLQAAIEAAKAGETVKLIADTVITEGQTIKVDKNITIDGDGKTVDCIFASAEGYDYDPTIRVETGATIKNINFTGLAGGAKDNSPIYIAGNGTEATPIVIENCSFTGAVSAERLVAAIISEGKTGDYLTVKDCEFTNVKYAAYFNGLDNATIQDNTVNGTQYNAFVIEAGAAVFSGNSLTNIATKDFSAPYNYGIYANEDAEVTIQSGSVAMASADNATVSGKAVIYGGTYSSDVTALVAPDYVATKSGDVYVVSHAAHTGGEATCKDKAICKVCGEAYGELGAHGATKVKDTKTATCTAKGYTGDDVCTVCETVVTEGKEIDMIAHKTEKQNAKDATCNAKGYSGDDVCTVCKTVVTKGTETAMVAHTFKDGVCTACEALDPDKVLEEDFKAPVKVETPVADAVPEVSAEVEAESLLNAEEKKDVEAGAAVTVALTVKNAEETATESEKKAIEEAAAKVDEKTEVALFLELDLTKKVGDAAPVEITELSKPVTITIAVPEELQKAGRTFVVYRLHDGKVDELKDLDNDPATVTIETDRFSTYALAYADAKVAPNTADTAPVALWAMLMVASIAGAAVLMKQNGYKGKRSV